MGEGINPLSKTINLTIFEFNFSSSNGTISRFCFCNLLARSRLTHAHITCNTSCIITNRCRIGRNPIMITIFSTIFNNLRPRTIIFYGCPKVSKNLFRHVRMTQNIMWLSHQFCPCITACFNKGFICFNDVAL